MRYSLGDLSDSTMGSYIDMVRKVYPDFDATRQYCLWIVPDFWDDTFAYEVRGSVKLFDSDGDGIVCMGMPAKADQLTRTPYPNKGIRQVGIRCGRKRCFGIPLVFDTFDGMRQVDTVRIHWDILMPRYLHAYSDKAVDVGLTTLDVTYRLTFENGSDNHWFTLGHQDLFFNKNDSYRKQVDEYYDDALLVSGVQLKRERFGGYERYSDMMVVVTAGDDCGDLTDRQSDIVRGLLDMDVSGLAEMARKYEDDGDVMVMGVWDLEHYYYGKSIFLTADPHPDILPEPSFGFGR